jgi:cytochrome c peroxidase
VVFDDVARAIATYERTLISADSAFDRYYYGGEPGALGPGARRGLELFLGRANCATCHRVGPRDALFLDQAFHNTGVGYHGAFRDLGLGGLRDARSNGSFFTPSLRNVALTAPYMHDGSLVTLAQVVEFYDRGGNRNPNLDPALRPLHLSAEDRADLVEFLRSLTGRQRYTSEGRPAVPAPAAARATSARTATFAAIEYTPVPGDVRANQTALARLVRQAAAGGARVVVLPEHALTGPLTGLDLTPRQMDALAAESDVRSVAFFAALARARAVWIALPVLENDVHSGRHHLATRLIDDTGAVVARQRKLRPRVELGDGAAAPADAPAAWDGIDTPYGRLASISGDDLGSAAARLAERGVATVLVSASWSEHDGIDWRAVVDDAERDHHLRVVVANAPAPGEAARGAARVVTAALPVESSSQAAPLGLPATPRPSHPAATDETVRLGQRLFFDPSLSGDGRVSCASCHDPSRAFTDARTVALGVQGRRGTRNTPTLLNVAYRPLLSWEGTVPRLEQQILRALHSWAEMDMGCESQVDALERQPKYVEAFRRLTGSDGIRHEDVARVIGDYVRTLRSGGSSFDRYFFGGERSALGRAARRGLQLFVGRAGCSQCHAVGPRAALFTDNDRHNTGVGYHQRFEYLGYAGDGLEVNFARRNAFKGKYLTPSLRDVARTAPYMHDGSLATLEDVVRFYDRGGTANPFLDRRLRPLGLSGEERLQLVAFLKSLTGEQAESGRPDPSPARIARR